MCKKDPKQKIIDIMKSAKPSQDENSKSPEKQGIAYICGDGNIVGNGNIQINGNINLTSVSKKRVIVKPAEGSVDPAQKAEIQRLIEEWIEAHNKVKQKTLSWGAAWRRFNQHFHISTYHELPSESFEEARKWLTQQKAQLLSMKSAPKKIQSWRPDRIKAIKARCKNQLGDEKIYRFYIEQRFGKSSLTQLSDNELQATYVYIMSQK